MNRTTTTPDGVTHRINTDQPYEYAVALNGNGTGWVVVEWAVAEHLAESTMEFLRRGYADQDVALLAVEDADDEEGGIK